METSQSSTPDFETASPASTASRLLKITAGYLVVALCLTLPFEAKLFRLGFLLITIPEFFLYGLIGCWLGSLLLQRRPVTTKGDGSRSVLSRWLSQDPVRVAAGLWIVVILASAVAATTHRLEVLKFTLRTSSGILLYLAVRDLAQRPSLALALSRALVAGAVLSSACTFFEAFAPGWTSWWRLFRPGEFSVSGMARASGTFAFPNIAAMYWEAVLPLLFVVSGWSGSGAQQRGRLRQPLTVLLLAILARGIVVSATRASIYGVVLVASSLVVLSVGARIRDNRWPARAWGAFGGTVLAVELLAIVVALLQNGTDSVIAQRLSWRQVREWTAPNAAAHIRSPDGVATLNEAPFDGSVGLPTRVELWTAALRLWRRNPLLGVGPDNFRHTYFEVIHPVGGGDFNDQRIHANNLYLETLADLGLIGAIALGFLLFSLGRVAKVAVGRSDHLATAASLGIAAFVIHGTVDYFLEFTPTLSLWWILIALASRSPVREP